MTSRPITPAEARWLCAVLEAFTATQERKRDEKLRASAWAKLSEIARSPLSPRERRRA